MPLCAEADGSCWYLHVWKQVVELTVWVRLHFSSSAVQSPIQIVICSAWIAARVVLWGCHRQIDHIVGSPRSKELPQHLWSCICRWKYEIRYFSLPPEQSLKCTPLDCGGKGKRSCESHTWRSSKPRTLPKSYQCVDLICSESTKRRVTCIAVHSRDTGAALTYIGTRHYAS